MGWGKVPGMGLGSGCIFTTLEPGVILGPLGLTICRAQGAKVTGNQAADEEDQKGPKTEEVCMWERLWGNLEGTRSGRTLLKQAQCLDGCPQGVCWKCGWPGAQR